MMMMPVGVQAKDKKKEKKNIPMTEIQTTGTHMGKATLENIISCHP